MNATALLITDEVTTCDCCGKAGLKRTVLMRLDDDSLVNFGTTCAARNTGKTSQQVTKEVRHARDMAHGSCGNRLTELRRQGVRITRDVIREVHDLFPAADLTVLIRSWA